MDADSCYICVLLYFPFCFIVWLDLERVEPLLFNII